MLIADRKWYAAILVVVVEVPVQLGLSQEHHPSPYQFQTYRLHPLPSACLLAIAGDVLESRLLRVTTAKQVPAECEASLAEQLPRPLAKAV